MLAQQLYTADDLLAGFNFLQGVSNSQNLTATSTALTQAAVNPNTTRAVAQAAAAACLVGQNTSAYAEVSRSCSRCAYIDVQFTGRQQHMLYDERKTGSHSCLMCLACSTWKHDMVYVTVLHSVGGS
jgi:hypothetical protein